MRLRVEPEGGEAFERRWEGEELVIGRAAECGLRVDDRYMSRRHARLLRRGGEVFVEDLGSRNGTLLNGRRIEGAQRVAAGDRLRLSKTEIALEEVEPSAVPPGGLDSTTAHTVFRAAELIEREESASGPMTADDESRRWAERWRLLNQVHRGLARAASRRELLDLVLDEVFDHLGPEEGAIYLARPDGGHELAASRRVAGVERDVFFSQTLVREVSGKQLSILVEDALVDERFSAAQSLLSAGVRSLVAAPLLHPEGSLGMIALATRLHVRRFSAHDLELLTFLASAAALRLWSLSLAEEAAERRRMEREVELARRIQVALLPAQLPAVPGYELSAGNLPSRGVSGDLYQVLEDGSGGHVLMVADVSGKGIAASLLTATLEALAEGPIAGGMPMAEVCELLGRRLHRRTPADRFATAFLARLAADDGRLTWASAGHNPALLVRAGGEVEKLPATGLPLGLMAASTYGAEETLLAPGDLLVVYTDGLTEAVNGEDEEYGLERLSEVARRCRRRPLAELAREIERDLEEFAAGVPFADDRTLVLLRRDAAPDG